MLSTESLRIFSQILTKEAITLRVDSKASTASFNLHKRILTIPDWSFKDEHFTKMLASHECAHAIYTPLDGWVNFIKKFDKKKQGLAKTYLNIVEDCRIDRMIQERYSGLKKTYALSARYLIDSDFLKIKGKKPIGDYSFINRINIHFKTKWAVRNLNVPFSSEEQAYIDRIAKLITWDEVVGITEEIFNKFPNTDKDEEFRGLDDFEDSVEETESSKEEEEHKKQNQNLPPRLSIDEDGLDDEKEEKEKDEEKQQVFGPGISDGVETYENLMNQISGQTSNVAVSYSVSSGTLVLKKPSLSLVKTLNFSDVDTTLGGKATKTIRDYRSWVNLFTSKFEQKKRAREIQKTMFHRTGALDPMKMINYRISDDIFRTNINEEKQKNHGFITLVDCSGSMSSIFHKVTEQFYAIYAVCDKLNIPFQGYGFTSRGFSSRSSKGDFKAHISGGSINLYNFFDTRKNKRYNNNVLDYLYSGNVEMGGTPLADAIFLMIPHLIQMKTQNNLDVMNFVVLTDGGDGSGNVSQFLSVDNNIVRSNISSRGNYDNTYGLYTIMREVYGINVTIIDVSDYIDSSNMNSNDVSTFNSKGQVSVKNHGGADNCVMIKTEQVSSSNREIVNILTNALS